MSAIPALTDTRYALTRALPAVAFDDAVARVRAALAEQGFGVLTEIDFQATLEKKLGAQVRPYLVLGACNPPLAYRALQAEPGIGALLPCNVTVAADDAGGVVVQAIDPVAMFDVVGRDDLRPIAAEVRSRLEAAMDALAAGS